MFRPRPPDDVYSEPNVLTLLRFVGSLVFFVLAASRNSPTLNFIGLAIHWLGDYLDGFTARLAKQETVLGAEIDIIADRVGVIFFYVNYLHFQTALLLPIAVYLVNFALVDFYLSYQFLKFDLISPNYFYKVDRPVYSLNFSPMGKFCNSAVVTLILIFIPSLQLVALAFTFALIGVKVYSIRRLVLKSAHGFGRLNERKG